MAKPTPHPPALLLLAAFSRYEEALRWAQQRVEEAWAAIAIKSPTFEFVETDYYEPTMGPNLKKVFFAFDGPFDPAETAQIKLQTNDWERQYTETSAHPEPRPLNLDPGYITLGKLVLASTKDHAHRVYLDHGIYAEVTLYYRHGQWCAREWTFADYRREDYQHFFTECRRRLMKRPS